jgi:hypothetical protein
VAADRYVFLDAGASNTLWLRPGSYRLRSVDAAGTVRSEQSLQVPAPDAVPAATTPVSR